MKKKYLFTHLIVFQIGIFIGLVLLKMALPYIHERVIKIYPYPIGIMNKPLMQYEFALNLQHCLLKKFNHKSIDCDTVQQIIAKHNKNNNLMMLHYIRCDSLSYEIIASPYNYYNKKTGFYLLTQDTLFSLAEKPMLYYQNNRDNIFLFPQ